MARRRIRLTTVRHILTELGRQYRRADRGELPWEDAGAASRILREMRTTIEGSEIEQRLTAVEQTLAERDALPAPKPNGRPGHAR